jgi:DeoR/GlpR family transcriptional regulator of sugar metabolism
VSSWERKDEILRLLRYGRRWTVSNLANALDVCIRTVKSDIQELTARYPIMTRPGKNGGVWLEQRPEIYKGNLASYEQDVITRVIAVLINCEKRELALSLGEILRVHGSRCNKEALSYVDAKETIVMTWP